MGITDDADRRFLLNHEWYDAHFEELLSRYHQKYIVVDAERVIDSSDNLSELAKRTSQLEGALLVQVLRPDEEAHYLLL